MIDDLYYFSGFLQDELWFDYASCIHNFYTDK